MYIPVCVIEPPPVSTTDQVTPVFEELVTVAVKVRELLVLSGPDGPEILIFTVPEDVVDPPLPQLQRAVMSDKVTNAGNRRLFI